MPGNLPDQNPIFKHADRLTIAVINRRRNKLDEYKGVLDKATLIRDISLANPHRCHRLLLAPPAQPLPSQPTSLFVLD